MISDADLHQHKLESFRVMSQILEHSVHPWFPKYRGLDVQSCIQLKVGFSFQPQRFTAARGMDIT